MNKNSDLAKKSKAQVSVDMIVMLSIVLLIFLVVFLTVFDRDSEVMGSRTRFYAKAYADKAATDINTVCLAGAGSTKTIKLPDKLKSGEDYQIDIYPQEHIAEITWVRGDELMHYSSPILCNLTGRTSFFGDINVSESGDLSNESVGACFGYCTDLGYEYGICRTAGKQNCRDHGEEPGHGTIHHFCKVVNASVCCCGDY